MTPGFYRTIKLKFVYDAAMTKPTFPVVDVNGFFDVTVDSAEAKVEHGPAFDLVYTLDDNNPSNGTADNRIDSIYIDDTK